jgi:hypothetical protein
MYAADSLWSHRHRDPRNRIVATIHRDFVPRGTQMQDGDNTRVVHTTINRR